MGILQLRQNTLTVIEWLRREHKWDHNNLIRQSCIPLLWPVVVQMEQISEWQQRANIDVGTWCLHQPFHMRLSTWFWKWFFWNLQQIELVHIYYYKNINKYKQQIHALTHSFIHSFQVQVPAVVCTCSAVGYVKRWLFALSPDGADATISQTPENKTNLLEKIHIGVVVVLEEEATVIPLVIIAISVCAGRRCWAFGSSLGCWLVGFVGASILSINANQTNGLNSDDQPTNPTDHSQLNRKKSMHASNGKIRNNDRITYDVHIRLLRMPCNNYTFTIRMCHQMIFTQC